MNARLSRANAALALLQMAEKNPTRRGWREAARALAAALKEEMLANVARVPAPANDLAPRPKRSRKREDRPSL